MSGEQRSLRCRFRTSFAPEGEPTRSVEDDGESTINGVTWERLLEDDDQPDRALVRVDGGALTIVRGTVSYEELEDFVRLLR
ncbi:DUF4245 family protein [Jiangella alba]|uniref:DUF4245 family protein n=1 Tax=Jiangella alba TaxID=561176 RepID=UPI00083EFC89|nr:DUF4245 family protein [Jiangella alba]